MPLQGVGAPENSRQSVLLQVITGFQVFSHARHRLSPVGRMVNHLVIRRVIADLNEWAPVPRFEIPAFAVMLCVSALSLPSQVMAQPMQLPGAAAPSAAGTTQVAPPLTGTTAPAAKKAAPAVVKVPTEEAVLGRAYKYNGARGEVRMERTGSGYGLRLTAEGFQINNLTEPCAVSFGETPLPLKSLGRPAGVPRYQLEAPICPITFDVLDGALLATGPAEPCVIEAAQCKVDPRGLWGPDGRTLVSQSKDIERSRTRGESAVREGYRLLTAKASVPDQRMIAREQAGFSSERELICRDFQREGTHGYCAAKVTEARAAELRSRLNGGASAPDKPVKRKKPKPAAPKPAPLQGGPLPLQN